MSGFSPDLLHLVLALIASGLTLVMVLGRKRHGIQAQTLEELPVGLCVINSEQEVVLWNREMAVLSGTPAREATHCHVEQLPAPWGQALSEALDAGDEVIKLRLASGEGQPSRWVIAHASAAPGTVGQRAILLEDISDYQRLQDELLHRERLASIGRLAAGVAHEIGNPITGIACLAQNLGALEAGEEVSQSAEEILKQSRRVSRIVNSLLQFSHGGGVEQRVELIPCNVADCIDEAIHLLSLDKRADEITLENRCDRELLVTADKQLLLQVFVNLLDNALAAAPRNTAITAHAETAADQVRICVDNEGTAIHPEVLAQVFEPFFTTRDIGEGTGLGLPLVKGMVEDMRGSVALHSPRPAPLNDGTRATVMLPRGSYTPGGGGDA